METVERRRGRRDGSILRVSALVVMLLLLRMEMCNGFTAAFYHPRGRFVTQSTTTLSSSSSEATSTASPTDQDNPLGLTPQLLQMTNAFAAIGDDKLRYKQLLYMANQLAPMDAALKTPEHQVPGCLSTVHVFASRNNADGTVEFVGDSDGLLTKGLVALLVRGLNGNSAEAIQKVDPQFINKAGISQSLTPGRNNGFLNMLVVMKQQAMALASSAEDVAAPTTTSDDDPSAPEASATNDDRPKYHAILAALQQLQPAHLKLTDNSHQHAGHAGAADFDGESHFDLEIVAEAFDGLNLVKRHQLVYMMLGEIMPTIHALSISAKTPSEAGM